MVMKATKFENHYRFEESIDVSHVTMVSKESNEFTRLWHQRLGHMSEKGLKVLVNRKLLPDLKSLNLNFQSVVSLESNVDKSRNLVAI